MVDRLSILYVLGSYGGQQAYSSSAYGDSSQAYAQQSGNMNLHLNTADTVHMCCLNTPRPSCLLSSLSDWDFSMEK